jgi:hypothetical protein
MTPVEVPAQTEAAAPPVPPPLKIWACKIGEVTPDKLQKGESDGVMRDAVEAAYKGLTGEDPKFTFSGWGAELTEPERAVVENRIPNEQYEADVTALMRLSKFMLAHAVRGVPVSLGVVCEQLDDGSHEFSIMMNFGREAADSPMVGGSALGLQDSLPKALDEALKQAGA